MLQTNTIFYLSVLLLLASCTQTPPMNPKNKHDVTYLLQHESWVVYELDHPIGTAFVRYRKPIIGATGSPPHNHLLAIGWAYADVTKGALPSKDVVAEMARFENYLVESVEHDELAVLAAVVTFDGLRQWVFYTKDTDMFNQRLSAIPDYHGQLYPIALMTENDPTWSYLRDQVLLNVPQ